MNIPYKNIFCEADRLATFKNWPFKDGPCCPENLAKAGFFYTGKKPGDDFVRCFVCFKGLNDWKENDDPFKEHVAHNANCEFVKLGQDQSNMDLTTFFSICNIACKNVIEAITEDKKQEELEIIRSYDVEI